MEEIAGIIEGDSVLCCRLLKMVNSPFYGLSSQVETIDHALNIMGTGPVLDMALTTIVRDKFKGIPKNLINMDSFWQHSIACGLTARNLAKQKNADNVNRFYVMGLLHDIGRLLIYTKVPDLARETLAICKATGKYLFDAEREVMGFTHAQLGGELLKSWDLPESLTEAVSCHHHPLDSKRHPLETAIMHVANFITNSMQLGGSGDFFVPPLDGNAWEKLGLSLKIFSVVPDLVEKEFVEKMRLFNS
jgi:putative nucleotidyltransferase with HDIG domain